MKRIAVDAMGGEHAPGAIIKAVLAAKKTLSDVEFVLFGDQKQLSTMIPKAQGDRIKIVATSEMILDQDEPVRAIRSKKDASMVVAARYVKEGHADALLSLGNTGALLACGIFIIGRIKGVERPALMPTLPAPKSNHGFNLLDVGANAQSKPIYFLQWAQMATYYAQSVRGIANPKVALLNNGSEFDKGDPAHQAAYQLLKDANLNFIGNIEGNQLMDGKADVIVTDGFSGNIALKTIEGTSGILLGLLKEGLLTRGIRTKIGALLIKPALKGLKSKFDVAKYGGAVLLGLNHPVIKTHGRSDSRAVYYTLLQIDKMLAGDVIGKFKKGFAEG